MFNILRILLKTVKKPGILSTKLGKLYIDVEKIF